MSTPRELSWEGAAGACTEQFDKAVAGIWRLVASGQCSEKRAEVLIDQIQAKRFEAKHGVKRAWEWRQWAACGIVPHWINQYLTHRQLAVCAIIFREIKKFGVCKTFNAYIATAAGCSVKTVQRTIARLEELCVGIRIRRGRFDGRSNEATKITITCKKLYAFISRNFTSGLRWPATKIIDTHFFRPRGFLPQSAASEHNQTVVDHPPDPLVRQN